MQEKILKISACFCVALAIVACASFYYLPKLHDTRLSFGMEQLEQFILTKSENSGISAINTDVKANFPQQLRVELPAGCDASQVEVRQNYNSQTVDLIIPTDEQEFLYEKPLVGSSKNISDVFMDYAGGKAVI